MNSLLISPKDLQKQLESAAPLMVFDCSFNLLDPRAGQAEYDTQHIAGATYIHLDHHLSQKGDLHRASGGRHPLPTREVFAERLNALGFGSHMQAVVYDRQGANYCGRMWWMLKWCGHEAAAVLDGGLAAWAAFGGALESGPSAPKLSSSPAHGSFELKAERMPLATADTIASRLGHADLTLVDARAPARFRGEVEPLDPIAGHIPGALNRPFSDNLNPDGTFKSAAQLKQEFDLLLAGKSLEEVIHHCGSGVSAIPNLIAMELAGFDRPTLFAGSWSEWCNRPGCEVATG